ncbi:hypothetical protein [Ilumatobacter sp.]|uniref:hypothetical protein n=1 Tax=Ilumatobacter sp. TaxID=1967498 RepID=UPI0037520CE2
MAKHSFGAPVEDDILEVQGKEYRLQPFGMRAFRAAMDKAAEATRVQDLEGPERAASAYALSIDLIINAVHPDEQEAMLAHIEDSMAPALVSQIASAIMRGLTDVDPTQPGSSSDGSSKTGEDSTDGASDEEPTQTN